MYLRILIENLIKLLKWRKWNLLIGTFGKIIKENWVSSRIHRYTYEGIRREICELCEEPKSEICVEPKSSMKKFCPTYSPYSHWILSIWVTLKVCAGFTHVYLIPHGINEDGRRRRITSFSIDNLKVWKLEDALASFGNS